MHNARAIAYYLLSSSTEKLFTQNCSLFAIPTTEKEAGALVTGALFRAFGVFTHWEQYIPMKYVL